MLSSKFETKIKKRSGNKGVKHIPCLSILFPQKCIAWHEHLQAVDTCKLWMLSCIVTYDQNNLKAAQRSKLYAHYLYWLLFAITR